MAKDSESLAMSMGRTSKFFRHSIAYKFEDDKYSTKLQYIDWTIGKSAQLTPTAIFEQWSAILSKLVVISDNTNPNSIVHLPFLSLLT